jgi:RNA polymerase primary sigma factor
MPVIKDVMLKDSEILTEAENNQVVNYKEMEEEVTQMLNEAKRSSNSQNILEKYFRAIEKFPPLSREEEIELAIRAQNGDQEARSKLILSNLRFVITVAKSYINTGIPFADLISEGNIGLMTAVDRFDPHRGIHFISYAVWWIKQAILKYIAERSRLVRFPMNRTNELLKIERFINDYMAKHGTAPDSETISKNLGISKEDVELLLSRKSRDYVSFYSNVFDDSDVTFGEVFDVDSETPEEIAINNSIREEIRKIIDSLPEREREVIKYRFGFYGKEYSLKEVGEIMNLTKERIRQIENKALEKIKEIIKTKSPELIGTYSN